MKWNRKSPREAAMDLATQAELLPKLRDKLLDMVNQINVVLKESKNRGHNTKAEKSPFMGTGKGLTKKAKHTSAKYLEELPLNAVQIPGIDSRYRFCNGLGLVSIHPKNGKIQLLRLPQSTKTWNIRNAGGERVYLTLPRLRKALEPALGQKIEVA